MTDGYSVMYRVGPLFDFERNPAQSGQLDRIEAKLDRLLALLEKPKRERKPSAASEYRADFEKLWANYPKRAGSNPKMAAYKAFRARETDGDGSVTIMAGVLAYRAYCEALGLVGTPYVMQAARFFGPNKEYLNDWTPPEKQEPTPRTDDEWLALGKKRGLEPRAGESWQQFKDRVATA